MKQRLSILVLALCNLCAIWACYSPSDTPNNYKYYNVSVYHEHPVLYRPNYTEPNLKDWQGYAGKDIPLEQIAEVVYKFTVTDMQQCMRNANLPRCQENAFARLIFTDTAAYAARLLLLAKQVEVARSVYNDPWYYPALKNENSFYQLQQDIYAMIMQVQQEAENSQFFIERLMLQLTRVLFAQNKYEECVRLWEDDVQDWNSQSLMRTMIQSYVAGAYAQMGQKDKAYKYFLELGNYRAIADVSFTEEARYAEFIRNVYDHQPNCAAIVAPVLQSELQEIGKGCMEFVGDSARCMLYYQLMQHIIRTNRSKDMSLWYYTAAFLEDQLGQPQKAAQSIRRVAQYATSKEMQTNIRLMRIYLDAKTRTYDTAYEQELYNDLRWIHGLIKADSTRLSGLWDNGELDEWTVWYNISCSRDGKYLCYPYTMLRKIVLAEVAPRMNKAGKAELSIALSNYADNMLLKMLQPEKQRCYTNHFFMAMDTMPATLVERYAKQALQPQGAMQRFLALGGYVDKNYFCDIVGTLYLRERNYKKAMELLSHVDVAYQLRQNTYYNLCKNPFDLSCAASTDAMVDSKYNFASEMYHLQQVMENRHLDPNRRAYAMLNYALGMRNSYINVWALTQYSQGCLFVPGHMSWMTPKRKLKVLKDYDALVAKAFAMFTNDEAKALAYLRYRNNYTVVTNYPHTKASDYVRGCCDTYYDYYPIYTSKQYYENYDEADY